MNNNQEQYDLKILGEKIAHVIEAEKAPEATISAIENIIGNLTNENCIPIYDPTIIRTHFPMFITSSPNRYGIGVLHSLQSIIDALPEDQRAELKQFETSKFTDEQTPLDLSEVCQEFLGTNDETAHLELEQRKPAQTLTEHTLQIWAEKLSFLLAGNAVSETRKALQSIIEHAASEADDFYITSPEVIKIVFPMIIQSCGLQYGRGVLHSLQAVVETLPDETIEKLRRLEKRYEPNAAQTITEAEKLACQISDILNNPLLPEQLRNVIAAEINGTKTLELFTPENVLHNLDLLRAK